jgi:hypothetical protein
LMKKQLSLISLHYNWLFKNKGFDWIFIDVKRG